jgi:hypothetical protein
MKIRKGVRILLWTAGSVAAGMALLYLLRWPIAGGFVRSKAAELASQHLQADLEFGELGGSLLYGIEARRVTLRPRPGSPLRSAEIQDLAVEYGFLGSGEPAIRIDGARIALAAKEGPAPPLHETIRDVVSILRSLRFRVGRLRNQGCSPTADDQGRPRRDRSRHVERDGALEDSGPSGEGTLTPDGADDRGRATTGPLRTAKLRDGKARSRARSGFPGSSSSRPPSAIIP